MVLGNQIGGAQGGLIIGGEGMPAQNVQIVLFRNVRASIAGCPTRATPRPENPDRRSTARPHDADYSRRVEYLSHLFCQCPPGKGFRQQVHTRVKASVMDYSVACVSSGK